MTAEKQIVQALFDAVNEGHAERWLDLVAPTFVLNGQELTAAAWVAFGHALKRDDPEMVIHVDELLQEGDRVVARLHSTGRSTAPFLGYEPTGRRHVTKGVYIFTIADGRIVEAWDVWDFLGQLVQLGMWPPPGHTI